MTPVPQGIVDAVDAYVLIGHVDRHYSVAQHCVIAGGA